MLRLNDALRNARLDVIETLVGQNPVLMMRTGAAPPNCAQGNSGLVLATVTLPNDWMLAAGSSPLGAGFKEKSGSWIDMACDETGTVGHFRLYDASATTCFMQGTVTGLRGNGDMIVDAIEFIQGEYFQVLEFTLYEPNA